MKTPSGFQTIAWCPKPTNFCFASSIEAEYSQVHMPHKGSTVCSITTKTIRKKTFEIGLHDTLLGMSTRRLKKRQCPVFSKMLELRRNHTWTPKKPSTHDKKQSKSPWKHAKPVLKNLFGASGHGRRPILEASGAKRIIQIIQKQIQRPSCASQKTDQNTCTSSILHIPRRNMPRSLIPYQKHTSQPPCAHGFMH